MNSLTELYNQALVPLDGELEKQAAAELEKFAAEEEQMIKQAEEEDAAGRIMARGFADELQKLAGGMPPFIQKKMEEKKDEDEDEDEKKEKGVEKKAEGWRPTGGVAARQKAATNVGGGTYKKPTDVTVAGKYTPGAAKAKPMPKPPKMPKVTQAPAPGKMKLAPGAKARPM